MNMLKRRGIILEIAAVAAILTMGAFFRFYEIRTRPGFEWDEPLYETIAENTVKYGYPALRVEGGQLLGLNLFHPPFDHYLKGYWFSVTGESGVGQARVLAGIESMVLLLVTYLFVRNVADKKAALLALLLVSSDGWLIYTNRLNFLENAMMPIGVAGLCFYAMALKKDRRWCWVLAGVVLGLAAIYKHTGFYFLLVPVLTGLLTKGKVRGHYVVLLGAAALVILLYVTGMYLAFGDEYLFQTLVQIRRALGMAPSSGLTYGLAEVVQALANTYWIFFTTIICLIVGSVMAMIRLIQYIRKYRQPDYPVLLFWSVAAIAFLGTIALRAPHYLIIVLVPLYAFLAVELTPLLRQKTMALATPLLLIVVLALNFVTWHMRFVQRTDNALLATYVYVSQNVPADARVLTEDCVGVQLKQTYFDIRMHRDVEDLQRIDPTYIILYYSVTSEPPEGKALEDILQRSTFVTEFTGFKEVVRIYRVKPREVEVKNVLQEDESLIAVTPTFVFIPTLAAAPTEKPLPASTTTSTPKALPERPIATPTSAQSPTYPATLSPTVTATPLPSPTREERKYVVKKGDFLLKIAQELYGDLDRWRDIYKANRKIIKNPNLIYPGQVLVIPK